MPLWRETPPEFCAYIECRSAESTKSERANRIPFLDLVTPHVELEEELAEVFRKSLDTAGFIGGPMVEEFEQAFRRRSATPSIASA